MKKTFSPSVITAAITLTLSMILASCGGSSGPAAGGGQENSGPSEESILALDGTWVSDEGYAIRLDGSSETYDLRTPSGRVGSSNYFTSGAPDEYRIFFNSSYYQLKTDDGKLTIVPTDSLEDDPEALWEYVFTRDDSGSVDFYFDLADLNGTWKADDATLILDIDAMEYRLTSDTGVSEGTVNNNNDGRGWYISRSRFDSTTDEFIDDPAFLVLDSGGTLHLQADDPDLAWYAFMRDGTESNLAEIHSNELQEYTVQNPSPWLDDAGYKLSFLKDKEKYVLQAPNGRIGRGRLSFNPEHGKYEIFFNGADYSIDPLADNSDVIYLTLVGGTPAGDEVNLDGDRFTYEMFEDINLDLVAYIDGSWTDGAGFTLNIDTPYDPEISIDTLYDEENTTFDYVSPHGSESGILGNNNDGMGWYIPWNGDSDGKAYLIRDIYWTNAGQITFDTDDPVLAAVTLSPNYD